MIDILFASICLNNKNIRVRRKCVTNWKPVPYFPHTLLMICEPNWHSLFSNTEILTLITLILFWLSKYNVLVYRSSVYALFLAGPFKKGLKLTLITKEHGMINSKLLVHNVKCFMVNHSSLYIQKLNSYA